jgi:hypothetical protein
MKPKLLLIVMSAKTLLRITPLSTSTRFVSSQHNTDSHIDQTSGLDIKLEDSIAECRLVEVEDSDEAETWDPRHGRSLAMKIGQILGCHVLP